MCVRYCFLCFLKECVDIDPIQIIPGTLSDEEWTQTARVALGVCDGADNDNGFSQSFSPKRFRFFISGFFP